MMLLCGQSNRVWHYWAGRYPGSVGILLGPSYWRKVPLDKWMPFALDNDAFKAWRDNEPWNEAAWLAMLRAIKQTGRTPLWVAVPDVVTNREATINGWRRYADVVASFGWNAAFCVQDGMSPSDVPEGASTVFVGGSDGWKFPSLPMWCDHFAHVHCARVNAPEMIEACERLGCQSIDGTGWFKDPARADKLPAIERFIEGLRASDHPMLFAAQPPNLRRASRRPAQATTCKHGVKKINVCTDCLREKFARRAAQPTPRTDPPAP